MIGVLVFVVAVAAGVFVFMNKASAPTLPQSVGGLTKISDPAIDPTVEMFRSMAESQGVQADIGLYGTAGLPSAAIIWVTGADAPSDGQAFSEFAEGFNTGLGSGSLDEARRTTEVVDGISIECAPVVGEPPGSMCLWQEDDVLWMVFELSDGSLGSASDLAASVHQTVGA
jgi:hypothetical protein